MYLLTESVEKTYIEFWVTQYKQYYINVCLYIKVEGEETSLVVDQQVAAGGEADTLSESGSQDLFEGEDLQYNCSCQCCEYQIQGLNKLLDFFFFFYFFYFSQWLGKKTE